MLKDMFLKCSLFSMCVSSVIFSILIPIFGWRSVLILSLFLDYFQIFSFSSLCLFPVFPVLFWRPVVLLCVPLSFFLLWWPSCISTVSNYLLPPCVCVFALQCVLLSCVLYMLTVQWILCLSSLPRWTDTACDLPVSFKRVYLYS